MGYDGVCSTHAGAIAFPESRADAVRDRAKRGGLLLAIIVTHGLAILWLATRPHSLPTGTKPGISLIDLDAPGGSAPARAPPKPPRPTPDAVPPLVVVPSLLPSPAPDAPPALAARGALDTGMASGGCALALAAGQAILGDPRAMAELEALPPGVRTEADAVMLWDGFWQDPSAKAAARPIPENIPATAMPGAIRMVVQQVVLQAPPECRDAPVRGPQFIQLPGSTRTTTVVIGSGAWRWADLIRPDENCLAANGLPCALEPPARSNDREMNN